MNIIFTIVGILVLLIVHEFGHMVMAKKLGYNVSAFGIGIGPTIYKKKINETEYKICLLPIGAFVSIPELEANTLNPKDKLKIVFAGPFFNILLAIFLLLALSFYVSIAKYGIDLNVILNSIVKAFKEIGYFLSLVYRAIYALIHKTEPVRFLGIVSIGKVMSHYAESGLLQFVYFLSFLSLNLGVFNLLPFPALDGSFIAVSLYEIITKKTLNKDFVNAVMNTGLIILIVFMLYLTIMDVVNPIKI